MIKPSEGLAEVGGGVDLATQVEPAPPGRARERGAGAKPPPGVSAGQECLQKSPAPSIVQPLLPPVRHCLSGKGFRSLDLPW